MAMFKNFDWSFKSIAKIFGMILLGIIVVTIVISLVSFSFRTIFQGETTYQQDYSDKMAYRDASFTEGAMAPTVSILPPEPGYSSGTDAESFEVKEYSATVKTRKLDETCDSIATLKAKTYIIFETANKDRTTCSYRFKVEKDKEAEILAIIEKLKPENVNANVQSIKQTVEEYDKELEILQKKLDSIEDTLGSAEKAYSEVTQLATRKQDVESLALIIGKRLELINQLTNERLAIKEQIDRYNKSKIDQLDRLKYSFFNINIYEDLIIDWKQIKDSWKYELKNFVDNFNGVLQDLSINLITYSIRFVQVMIYVIISVLLLKFLWIIGKRLWRGRDKAGF